VSVLCEMWLCKFTVRHCLSIHVHVLLYVGLMLERTDYNKDNNNKLCQCIISMPMRRHIITLSVLLKMASSQQNCENGNPWLVSSILLQQCRSSTAYIPLYNINVLSRQILCLVSLMATKASSNTKTDVFR